MALVTCEWILWGPILQQRFHCSSRIWFKSSDKSTDPSSEEDNIVLPGKAGSHDEGTKLRTSPLTGLHTNKTHTAINMQRCFHFTTPTGVLKGTMWPGTRSDHAARVQQRHTLKKTHFVSPVTIILLQTWRNENKSLSTAHSKAAASGIIIT